LVRAARGVTLTRYGTGPLNGRGRGSGRARRARLFRGRSHERSGRRGGGRDRMPWPFGCYAVMIVHARTSGHFSTVEPACQQQTMSPAVNARGARDSRERGSPRSINREEGRGESLTALPCHLASAASVSCSSLLTARFLGIAPARFILAPLPPLLLAFSCNGSASAHHSARASALDLVDGNAI
jgi:hypothetical protein